MASPPPPRRPPPPPPLRRPPPPLRAGEAPSEAHKTAVAEMALGLLEEQVQARIVHYKADLATNPELDAITAQVVAQLRELQGTVGVTETRVDRNAIRASHEKLLRDLLARLFRPDAPPLLLEKRVKEIHRKLARQFFQSELHEKTRGKDGAAKVIQHGEQAIFYLLVRYEHRLKNELGGFDYASDEVKERAFDLLAKLAKDMQDTFLSRRSTELKRIVSAYHSVLIDFQCKQIAPAVNALASEVIAQSGTWEGRAFPYKIGADAFPRFRASFERRFMTRLVGFAEEELVERLGDTAGAVVDETLTFITDPRVFSMICGELCDGIYEYLCHEGFLDMPPDYRRLTQESADA